MTITIDELLGSSNKNLTAILNERLKASGYKHLRDQTAVYWITILRAFMEVGFPQTVRQLFYQLVSNGVLPKTENGYSLVGYHVSQMREKGLIPYGWIADNSRWMRKPRSFDSLSRCLQITRATYRRTLWDSQDSYVEVWCEKDALAGILYEVTEEWDVPLMVTRGFSSISFLYEAAEQLKAVHKDKYIYYLGDYDPSGLAASNDVKRKLVRFGAQFSFVPLAVLPWQIEKWKLPMRPTKMSDSRSKDWTGASVELDSIPADQLLTLVREAIEQHIDSTAMEETKRIEQLARDSFFTVLGNMGLD